MLPKKGAGSLRKVCARSGWLAGAQIEAQVCRSGRWSGFLFGWIQLVVVRPGDIAVMAFAFATYARELYCPFSDPVKSHVLYAVLAVVS